MARRLWIVFIIALLALSMIPALAASDQGAAFALDCSGFTGTGGSIQLNRDNTGNSREAFLVSVTDGAGNVIYEPIEDSFFVGGTVSWAGGPAVRWSSSPQFNPLVLRVVSSAGNGFDEELIVMALGQCEGLPTYNVLPSGVFVVDGDTLVLELSQGSIPLGSTSPTIELNTVPPRPKNDPASVRGLPGVLIVNTDNLSLRSGDGAQYTLVGIVDGGTALIPLGHNEDFSWWYVQAGNMVGWVKGEFVILRGDLSNVPEVPSRGEIAGPRMFIHVNQTLYSAPDSSSLPLCSIARDQEYFVVGSNGDASWYQLQAICDGALVNGWIPEALGSLRNPASVDIAITD